MNKTRRNVKRTPVVDRDTAMTMPATDVFVVGLGWLLSLHGFMFLIFCFLGVYTGIYEIYRSINNKPIVITHDDINGAITGLNVKILGTIDPNKSVIGKKKYGKDSYTLTIMENTANSIVIYIPGLLSEKALNAPVERWYEGELTILENGIEKIDGMNIPVKSFFRDNEIELASKAYVIADSIIPKFHLWHLIVTGFCAIGFSYIVYRVIWSINCVFDREKAMNYLFRNAK